MLFIAIDYEHFFGDSLELSHRRLERTHMSLINTKILPFKANAFRNGDFIEVSDSDITGKWACLLYTSPSPRDGLLSRMPSSA